MTYDSTTNYFKYGEIGFDRRYPDDCGKVSVY